MKSHILPSDNVYPLINFWLKGTMKRFFGTAHLQIVNSAFLKNFCLVREQTLQFLNKFFNTVGQLLPS